MPVKLSAWVDRTNVKPDAAGLCSLAIELTAHGSPVEGGKPRLPSRTVLALDVSASMKGEPLDQVIRSVDRLLDALHPDDEVGIVAFSQNATRVVEPVKVDASGKRLVRSRVGRLVADSGTNIEAGLDLSAAMMEGATGRKGVVLLSDGAPNVGAHTAAGLREVVKKHRPGIGFFSLGYGADHSEDVLAAVGDGGYEFVQDPTSCARAFARALGTQGDSVATGLELTIALEAGVELVRFVGHEQTRFSREGVVLTVADMVNGGTRIVVAELRIKPPGGDRFVVPVAKISATCKEGNVTTDIGLEVAAREPGVVADAARRVLLARADEKREQARTLADRGNWGGAANGLRALMKEIEFLPGWVVNDGSPLAEAYELLVDEAMAYERRPSAEQYAQFRKATMGSRLASQQPQSAKLRGDESSKLIDAIAGDWPDAWLVGAGARYPVREECVIGRTKEADICIQSGSVSRRHAEVFANAGEHWVADLGSTNTTTVNGKPLASAPHKLAPGDVIEIGGIALVYEIKK